MERGLFTDALNDRYVYYQKCSNCSAQFGCSVDEIDKIRKRCDRFVSEDYESFIWFCKNAVDSYDESVRYEVEEVDVVELVCFPFILSSSF